MAHRGVDDPRRSRLHDGQAAGSRRPPRAPEGYARTVEARDGVVRVRVHAPDGTLAARGQIAPTGATAVADQIETDAAHRRRGLGANVVRTLEAAAARAGAVTGVLSATRDGRQLYGALGWEHQGAADRDRAGRGLSPGHTGRWRNPVVRLRRGAPAGMLLP
ncbi:GNAT family N-acetyltransferase [Streptomyces sp. NPDC088915]|uniref:GNAT family N-acetyltransferase n=1 Tax=Streptomyces sp. NPDC088915 TaxID=3365912 RepID=UPI0037FBF3C0